MIEWSFNNWLVAAIIYILISFIIGIIIANGIRTINGDDE